MPWTRWSPKSRLAWRVPSSPPSSRSSSRRCARARTACGASSTRRPTALRTGSFSVRPTSTTRSGQPGGVAPFRPGRRLGSAVKSSRGTWRTPANRARSRRHCLLCPVGDRVATAATTLHVVEPVHEMKGVTHPLLGRQSGRLRDGAGMAPEPAVGVSVESFATRRESSTGRAAAGRARGGQRMSRRERMSAADAAWLHMDRSTNLMVINAVVWFDAPLDWTVLTKRIESRWIDRYPRFRQRVAEGRLRLLVPHWEDDPRFALENHLHHLALPAPGDQDALQDFVGDMMSVPIDRTKPLWHVYFIDGYGPGCAVLVRVHHSVADGIALTQVLQSLTDDAPEPTPDDSERGRRRGWPSTLAPITRPAGAAVTTAWRVTGAAVHSGRDLVAHPSRLGDVAATGWDDASTVARLVFTPPDARTAVTGETVVAKRAVWSAIPLDDVKAVGQATGATVNDVLLTAVTGALRRYLEAHGGVVDNIRTLVPVNLRPLDRPVPATLGNKFGLAFLDLPVGL